MDDLLSVADLIKENDSITLIAHVAPDGDTVGCVCALAGAIGRLGKRAQAVCEQTVPRIYAFLPGAQDFLTPERAEQTRVVIALDCADEARLGKALPLFKTAQTTCNIDHHITNTEYAMLNYVDGGAAAASEIVYKLILALGTIPSREEAQSLYTGIMTDTGNFAYTNTTPDTFRIAAELVAAGADNTAINRRVYRTVPQAKQRLLGRALVNLKLDADGRVGYTTLTAAEIAGCGALEEDTEGIIDHIRDIEGVEAAFMVRETGEDTHECKVALRAKEYADVGAIAKRMGGGGHKMASGYTARGDIASVTASALAEVCAAVSNT